MRRMIKVLAVTALVAVLLVTSVAPALGRPSKFGQRMPTDEPCTLTEIPRNGPGAHHVFDPPGHTGCWLVLPGQNS